MINCVVKIFMGRPSVDFDRVVKLAWPNTPKGRYKIIVLEEVIFL
jgi:hypothetical protein